MKVAVYARVSSETQAQRETIRSQLDALQGRVAELGHEMVAVYTDDGYSGARLDRPGLDALRDAAEAGTFGAVWCLSPDRLARNFAYQVLVTDELARLGVAVCYVDSPPIDDDPQARLLVQVQGLFSEYEKAKMAERSRRGKLYRVRCGEAIFGKVAYGYRRVGRCETGPAHLVIYEPEAVVVRRIFDDYASGVSMRQIARHLYEDSVPTPTGKKQVWSSAQLGSLLHNTAYSGTATWYRYENVPSPGHKRALKRKRPAEDWVQVPVPPIVTAETFAAAQAVVRDNSRFSPRNTTPGTFLLRGLVACGRCGVRLASNRKRSRNGEMASGYYACPHRDALKAGGPERRCTERHVRADELDSFVFDQVRSVLQRPELVLAGEAALAGRHTVPEDDILDAQLARIARQIEAVDAERRRLSDLYQAGLITLPDLKSRAQETTTRRARLQSEQHELQSRHQELAGTNQLRQRIGDFAARVADGLDQLDFDQRQHLLRLVVEEVRVTDWQVEIRLRIPLDDQPPNGGIRPSHKPKSPSPTPKTCHHRSANDPVSSENRLRSTHRDAPRRAPPRNEEGRQGLHPQAEDAPHARGEEGPQAHGGAGR
ncbi:MAG: recombinase family protein, partial [Acidimicrobiales bacterium]